MKIPQLKYRENAYLLLSFVAPCASMLLLMLFAGYNPFGNRSMLYSDMWHQYYPFFKDFRTALLSGDSLLYNWHIGMGLDYLGLVSYYLASPLNLLSVLLPESWTLGYFGLLMPIKLGFAGLFFALFLKKSFGRNDLSLPLFGWFYAMCAWALGFQWNVMWLDTFALLPLVIMGTVSLLKDKKFFLYTVTLFLSIFANYYIGFFTCIFVLLVFICYQVCQCKGVKRFFSDLFRIALFSILAIGMTAVLELPALAGLQTTQSSVNSYPEHFSMNIVEYEMCTEAKEAWDLYKETKEAIEAGEAEDADLTGLWWDAMKASFPPIMTGMRKVAGNMGGGLSPTFKEGLPNIYSGVGTIVLAFLFLLSGKIKLREKICCVLLLVFFILSFLLRQLDYIWHGFHFTNMIPYRFSFLYSFVMLYMAYRALLMRRQFKLWQIIPAGILAVCILLCSDSFRDPVYIVYNAIFLLLYVAALVLPAIQWKLPPKEDRDAREDYFLDRKTRRLYGTWGLVGIMCLELVANLVNFGVRFPYTAIANYPRGTAHTQSMINYMHEDKDLFFRAEVTHSQTLNDSALNGYNGISTFTSSANVNVTQFMRFMGYSARNTYNRYTFEESSPVSNLFLNLKYMIERDGQVEENPYFEDVHHYGKVHLLENKAYLPLGFLAEPELGEFAFKAYNNNFIFQNKLFEAATGIKEDVWNTSYGTKLTIDPNGTGVTSKSSGGYSAYTNGNKSTILIYRYEIKKGGFFCVDMNLSARNSFTVWRNGKQLFTESLSLPQTLAISQVKQGDIIEIQLTCKANESGSVVIRSALLDDKVFQKGYEVLSASTLELTEFSNTKISGYIDCNRDGLLYTSVPQNGESWSVTVDGQEAEIVLVGDVMIGIPVTEGLHEIQFTYRNHAFELGAKVSLGCALVFLAITAWVYRPWEKYTRKGKYEK